MAKDMMGKVAIWAFIIGALIALLVGLWQAYTLEQNEQPVFTTDMGGWIAWILAILGAVVGLLAMLGKGTITKSEVPAFLMAGIALLVMPAVTAYLALNFTGCTTFASRSGVRQEIFLYVPVMAFMGGAGVMLMIFLGVSRLMGWF